MVAMIPSTKIYSRVRPLRRARIRLAAANVTQSRHSSQASQGTRAFAPTSRRRAGLLVGSDWAGSEFIPVLVSLLQNFIISPVR
jgi:hypothetical protein